MQLYLDFIESQNLSSSAIYPLLKCSESEAKILQHMAKSILEGESEFEVLSLLESLFGEEKKSLLAHLPHIKNLIDLGWISHNHFAPKSLLELLNESIHLSHSFLKLLEDGDLEISPPENKPYQDYLEYLKDEFLRIDLLAQIASLRFSYKSDSPSLSKITYRLNLLDAQISQRLKLTHKTFEIRSIIQEAQLTAKEQTIFFALLKEEYYGGESNLREMNTLIELISQDEYDRIKNRSLLDEKANLLAKELIDYDELLNPFGGITRTYFVTEKVLQKVIHPSKHKKKTKNTLSHLIKDQDIFELIEPKKDLKDIILPDSTRKTLESLLKQMDPKVISLLKSWGIKDKKTIESKIIFYGSAGTGKTLTALALAKSLKKPVLHLDCSNILSMYVGESEKNVKKIFETYQEIAKKSKNEPVLLLDEADQFLSTRTTGGYGADKMHNQMQNIFLDQIERFEGVLIATTNLLETLDLAFSRRFNYKIQFNRPTKEQRDAIWNLHLPRNAEFSVPSKELVENLSRYDLTGGQIALVVKNTSYKVATREDLTFYPEDFIEEIQKEKSGSFDSEKNVGFDL